MENAKWKQIMPEYQMKELICRLNQRLLQRDLGGKQYFSISIRCGADEIWMASGTQYGEFLTPDKLRKISFRFQCRREEETEAMIRYHRNIYQIFEEIQSVITVIPPYQKFLVKEKRYPGLPDVMKYNSSGFLPEERGYLAMEERFLTAAGRTPYDAYEFIVNADRCFKKEYVYRMAKMKEEPMTGQISKQEVEEIVSAVLKNVSPLMAGEEEAKESGTQRANSIYGKTYGSSYRYQEPSDHSASLNTGKKGVFRNVRDAVVAAEKAQAAYARDYSMEDREKIINSIRAYALRHKEELAGMNFEETKLGRYEDKIAKIELVAKKTPGTEILTTYAKSGDSGLMIEEMGAYGVIGAVSPVTNPTETLICNAIGMLASGNSAVYNVHPSGKNVSAYTVDLINQAVMDAGGPENLITMVSEPTMETLQEIINSPEVKLLCGTGGPGLVKTLLSSGKKAIGAGAGNPPVIVDDTADLALAAREIYKGASFENNILCIAEKEVFVLDSVADELIYQMIKQGAYMMSPKEAQDVSSFALMEDEQKVSCGCSGPVTGKYHINKKWVGKDASLFLKEIGVTGQENTRLLIFEADWGNPFVQLEQMMPVLPIVRVKTLEEAIELAVETEHGNRHTASMFSKNVNHLTEFARKAGTTIFVKNACTMAGVGFGGEGYTTFTIAGPTGEGLTSARTFTRVRRCVLAEGGFHIV